MMFEKCSLVHTAESLFGLTLGSLGEALEQMLERGFERKGGHLSDGTIQFSHFMHVGEQVQVQSHVWLCQETETQTVELLVDARQITTCEEVLVVIVCDEQTACAECHECPNIPWHKTSFMVGEDTYHEWAEIADQASPLIPFEVGVVHFTGSARNLGGQLHTYIPFVKAGSTGNDLTRLRKYNFWGYPHAEELAEHVFCDAQANAMHVVYRKPVDKVERKFHMQKGGNPQNAFVMVSHILGDPPFKVRVGSDFKYLGKGPWWSGQIRRVHNLAQERVMDSSDLTERAGVIAPMSFHFH